MNASSPPVVLTIAGSDCSAGAGIQADLKTFTRFATFGLTAVTCVVSETPRTVRHVHPVPPAIVADQVRLLLDSYPVAAIKTGMLFSPEHIAAIAEVLSTRPIPLVVDPVMVASSGDSLMQHSALAAYRELLLPLASVITPNLPEASALLGRAVSTLADLEPAARELARLYQTHCLLKGGHLAAGTERLDLLAGPDGQVHLFAAPWIDSPASHGTGCTLAAAIAAGLAHGQPLLAAVAAAKKFISAAIASGHSWTSPDGQPIHALNQNVS
jgi:hydroxymethylpyrimidine/phosphomethylpyrimidine kinase